MFNQLQRAINLSQKTGDKLIVFDSRNPKNSYVLIPFDEYEKSFNENCECCQEDCDLMDEIDYNDDYSDDEEIFEKYEEDEDDDEGNFVSNFDTEKPDFSGKYEGDDDYFSTAKNHLTEEEQIDKINRVLSMSSEADLANDDSFDKMDFLQGNFDNKSENRASRGNSWNIPGNIKASAEEVIEEDRHYLEEITF